MQIMTRAAVVLATAGLAFSAAAQDSVSSLNTGLPGDALSPFAANQQTQAYTLDLTRRFGSWPNTRFGIAPILKTTAAQPGQFFNNLNSSSSISPDLLRNVPGPSVDFPVWYAPGVGINPNNNTAPTRFKNIEGVPTNQFAVGISEFATVSTGQYNGLVTGIVNQDPTNARQLFVRRTLAISTTNNVTNNTGSIGFGTIDAHGNAYVRADSFNGSAGVVPALAGNNIFRIRTADRTNAFNLASPDAAFRDASDHIVVNSTVTLITPSNLPQSLASAPNGLYWGANFDGEGVYGDVGSVVNVGSAHRPGAGDQRGLIGSSTLTFPGLDPMNSAVMTYGIISRDSEGGTDSLSIWSADSTGAVTGTATFFLPGQGAPQTTPFLQHPCYPQLSTYPTANDPVNPIGDPAFAGYRGAIAFRGGNGHVAIGRDNETGEGLLAATLYLFDLDLDFTQAIVVCRFDPNNPSDYTWEVAAQVDPFGLAGDQSTWQPIHGDFGNDGAAFSGAPGEFDGVLDLNPASPTYDAPIGTVIELRQVTGGSPAGPSLSPPAFDAAGNLYFIAAVELNKWDSQTESVFVDPDSALLKAHRVSCGSTTGYRLELITELGDTFLGRNSRTPWQIQFMGIASGGGGLNPGAFFSNYVLPQNFNGIAYNNLGVQSNASPSVAFTRAKDNRAFGGLVVNASIVYDAEGNGTFSNPTSANGDPASLDEGYNALLYIGYIPCVADVTGPALDGIPDEVVSVADLNFFISRWLDGDIVADITGPALDGVPDGVVTVADLNFFISAWLNGCE
ncbi:MAG: hypothetical protein EA378_05530 [Phycisphaerales bacterium]|nr:MAG: hypothetical protein EA378_05530 [Phycisphaerales bacterium]